MLKKMFSSKDIPKNKAHNKHTAPSKVDVPKGLMTKCPDCHEVYYSKDLEKNLNICYKCGHHGQLTAKQRIACLLDCDSFEEWDADLSTTNPLNFPDYIEKVERDQEKTGLTEAVVSGRGLIEGNPVSICVMDAGFRMGSMGSVVGEKIARAVEGARQEDIPFLIFTASGGARMQEGVLSLMQMTKVSVALKRHSNAGLLMISVMTNPTTGGVSASFASQGDYNFAEPGALIGFAGRRIIEQTIREKLPKDFQTAEFLMKHGQLDKIIHRHDMRETLGSLIRLHMPNPNRKESEEEA